MRRTYAAQVAALLICFEATIRLLLRKKRTKAAVTLAGACGGLHGLLREVAAITVEVALGLADVADALRVTLLVEDGGGDLLALDVKLRKLAQIVN